MEPIIELENVCFQSGKKYLLENVTCKISAGDRIAMCGASGSGKSVCLRLIGLLDNPSSGRLSWKRSLIEPQRVPFYRQNVIYIHQKPVFIEGTVEDNFRLPFAFKSHAGRQYDGNAAVEMLEKIGRDPSFLKKQTNVLSGGESQIVSILRAMLLNPSIILLDEPTSALDENSTILLEKFILGWQNEKPNERALIWVTHQKAQAHRISNKQWEMCSGSLKL